MRPDTSPEVAAKVFNLLNYGTTKVLSDTDARYVAHLAIETITSESELEILSLICDHRAQSIKEVVAT